MKIGFPTHPRRDLVKEIEWIGQSGFDLVEFFLEEDMAIPDRVDVAQINKTVKAYNLATIGHTAWYLPIGSAVAELREAAVSVATRYFEVFRKLGVEYATIHANWPNMLFSQGEGVAFQLETLKILIERARANNLKLLYESTDSDQDSL